ncbi:uncharacterized protein PSFLO_07287 [Pseudozyma flocculosa]|uniref:Defects in morphology protein 1 n=2 Tax=Pseudozyma flocculosa TaxID=84751 RepID=A0A5C3FDP0_9BASI|nr:uncharacterized protein PSFLO_07287 [Pseudozyma flocculosa]
MATTSTPQQRSIELVVDKGPTAVPAPPSSQSQDALAKAHAAPTESQAESQTSQPSRSRRGRKWSPPSSLQDHFRRKGYLSVTELTSPSWCEYNYQYSVIGALSTLPASQRPAAITTPDGATLQPSLAVLEEKERVLDKGKAVHAQLEWEAQPGEAVQLDTSTKEDSWAARLLDTWCKLQWLNRGGAARELELCGWIQGELVRGVVDEVVRRPLDQGAPGGVADTVDGEAAEAKQKVWASQEEWKREQRRKPKKAKAAEDQADAKFKTTKLEGFGFTPPGKKTDAKGTADPAVSSSQLAGAKGIADTAGSSSQSTSADASPGPASQLAPAGESALASAAPMQMASAEPSQDAEMLVTNDGKGWGYFLSDTKTRVSPFLPAEQDQAQARRQCMIYKRLFDGMCLGALASQRGQAPSQSEMSFDPHATPIDWIATLESLSLSPHETLSSGFLASALPLAESWGCDLFALPALRSGGDGAAASEGCTLSDIVALLERGLCDLVDDARRGSSLSTANATATEEPRGPPADDATSAAPPTPATPATPGPPPHEVMQSTLTLSYIHQPSTLNRQGKRHPSRGGSKQKPKQPRRYLGHVSFAHDADGLQAFLVDALELWRGSRALRGVTPAETRRCWHCVWQEGCEWRQKMADEVDERIRTRKGRVEAQGGAAPAVAAAAVPAAAAATATAEVQVELEMQVDVDVRDDTARVEGDDDELWSQFSDISASELADL